MVFKKIVLFVYLIYVGTISLCTIINTIPIQQQWYNQHGLCKTLSENKYFPWVAVIGTGYVGLVTGAGLAELGNYVVCADIDVEKITLLQRGIIPIYEPGLTKLIEKNRQQNRLLFTADVEQALSKADVICITIGTPMTEDGTLNLTEMYKVIKNIARSITHYVTIIIKSTVPVGTGTSIRHMLEDIYNIDSTLFDIVSNPEFLREGSAVNDFLQPDRLVIGTESIHAAHTLYQLYESLAATVPFVYTNIETAEIIKYASNAFLATKLSFINEIAHLCDKTGSNAQTVAYALGLDHRISPYFLKPGPGYGGSCLPKDVQALVHLADTHSVPMYTVQGAIKTNQKQLRVPVKKLKRLMNSTLQGKKIAILGLAFKANTDDIRFSPALTVIKELHDSGSIIYAYDPEAMENTARIFPFVHYCASTYDALTDADAAIIMTEWEEFKSLNIERMASLMKGNVIVDARNILNLTQLRIHGFICDGIGQGIITRVQR